MAATDFDVKYVANLARLNLSPEEEQLFGAQLGQVLGYIEKLKQVDVPTWNLPPTPSRWSMWSGRTKCDLPSPTKKPCAMRRPKPTGCIIVPKIVE
jgi:aspartyl-tRNA(Asn)/glutamyl-tRNA(Gln) amidotransferase subunit C